MSAIKASRSLNFVSWHLRFARVEFENTSDFLVLANSCITRCNHRIDTPSTKIAMQQRGCQIYCHTLYNWKIGDDSETTSSFEIQSLGLCRQMSFFDKQSVRPFWTTQFMDAPLCEMEIFVLLAYRQLCVMRATNDRPCHMLGMFWSICPYVRPQLHP